MVCELLHASLLRCLADAASVAVLSVEERLLCEPLQDSRFRARRLDSSSWEPPVERLWCDPRHLSRFRIEPVPVPDKSDCEPRHEIGSRCELERMLCADFCRDGGAVRVGVSLSELEDCLGALHEIGSRSFTGLGVVVPASARDEWDPLHDSRL